MNNLSFSLFDKHTNKVLSHPPRHCTEIAHLGQCQSESSKNSLDSSHLKMYDCLRWDHGKSISYLY